MITLITNDNQEFQVGPEVVQKFKTIKNLMEDGLVTAEGTVPLSDVTGKTLEMVVAYANAANEVSLEGLSQEALFDGILASNYLEYTELLDTLCHAVANMIKGKTPDEIRKLFNITNDFTPEEEEQVRKENEWVDER